MTRKWSLLGILILFITSSAIASSRTVDLTVAYRDVNFTGKSARAISVNNQIPAPTLRFTEGDVVTLNVHNQLDKETAIHWHGLLVPWQMDGVKAITQKGIPSGKSFQYKFKLRQSGTYWYHAHAGLQEQEGLYGAFVIEPKNAEPYHYDKDIVIVLSDWKNTLADQIFANLKKSGEYYAPNFPLQASLMRFIQDYRHASAKERMMLKMDYQMMQQMRMGIYDFSDIAYDAFLLNGRSHLNPWSDNVKVGDVVRLRFIDAGASTFFRIKVPGSKLQMVQVQGNNVRPYQLDSFTMGPGETNDVLVKIAKDKPYIIYAESFDTLGAAYGVLKTRANQPVSFDSVKPFPIPPPATRTKMANQKKRGTTHMHQMGMQSELNKQPLINTITAAHLPNHKNEAQHAQHKQHKPKTVGTKYQHLKAKVPTNDPGKPVYKKIKLDLFGFMDRFIWLINGVPEYNSKPIALLPGKRYRLIFTNNSMMHHPMHIHGHWFILRNGHGKHDPLLHTIDIPPGSQVVADLDTDASGQWFFHCHMLYHMVAGMSRTFQYSSIVEVAKGEQKPAYEIKSTPYYNRAIVRVDELRPIPLAMVERPLSHPKKLYFSNHIELGEDPFHDRQTLTFTGLYGPDFNKLQLFINDAESEKGKISNADLDIFYWRLIDQFWAIKGGINYYYRPSSSPYFQPGIGIEGLMPYFIDTNLRLYMRQGSLKADLEFGRNTQITNNFFIGLELRGILATKTIANEDIGSGLNEVFFTIQPNYRLAPGINAFIEYEHVQYYGVRKSLRQNQGESSKEDSVFFGLGVLF